MSLQPGDVLSSDALKEDLRRIYNLNYFETVEPNLIPSLTDPGQTDLEIHVKEKRTSTATFGLGTSQITGTYGSVDLFLDNLWGEAKSLLFKTQFGSQYSTYQVRYHDPWALGYRTSFTGSIWSTQQINYITVDREQRNGYSLAVGKPIATHWRGTVSWLSEDVAILSQGTRTINGVGVSNNTQPYNRRVVGLNVNYDTRDFVANPHTGEFYDFAVDKGLALLGGTVDYWTFSAQGNWFYPVIEKHTVATRVWTNFATGQLQEGDEYFVGSDRTVRGYNRPFSQGRERYLANVEYRIDINEVFQGVFFADIGGAFNSISPIPYKSDGFRMGKGAGVRINTPLGPIRLDLGWGDGYDGNFGPVLHFSIGHAF
jgi:outer membrane protein insertion porin family